MTMREFPMVVGDTSPAVAYDTKLPVGALDGATARFHLAPEGGGARIIDAAAIVDESTRVVTYQWASGDLALDPGRYIAEFQITYGVVGTVGTWPRTVPFVIPLRDPV